MKNRRMAVVGGILLCAVLFTINAQAAPRQLNIYNWVEYLPADVIKNFERDTGITVSYDVFDSAQTLEAKLLTGNSGYDVVFPGSAQVANLIAAGAALPLQRDKLPNWHYLDPAFMASRAVDDPGNRYAVPYLWGTTLIGYNRAKVKAALGNDVDMNDWDVLFKPENAAKLKSCGIAVLDASDEVMAITLNYLGLNPNSRDKADYAKAQAAWSAIRPSVRYFNSSKFVSDLANGDICLAVGWSGAVLAAQNMAAGGKNGVEIEMALPKQGTLMWSDDMMIAKGARNIEEAHMFINYLLRPDVIARVTNEIGYPNPNAGSEGKIRPDLLDNKNLFVTPQDRQTLFMRGQQPMAIERIITRTWNTIKTGT